MSVTCLMALNVVCRYKVEGLVMEKPCRIVDYIRPGPYRLQWDSLMTTMDIVQTLDKV